MAGLISGQPLISVPALISGACKCEVAKESLNLRWLKIVRYRDCLDCLGEPHAIGLYLRGNQRDWVRKHMATEAGYAHCVMWSPDSRMQVVLEKVLVEKARKHGSLLNTPNKCSTVDSFWTFGFQNVRQYICLFSATKSLVICYINNDKLINAT